MSNYPGGGEQQTPMSNSTPTPQPSQSPPPQQQFRQTPPSSFTGGYNYPPSPPVRNNERGGSSEGRTARYVIVAMLTGLFAPVCACAILLIAFWIGAASFFDNFESNSYETGEDAIGVIDINGLISTGDSFGATTGYTTDKLEWMEENSDVKAIVIRMNSPGGDASASDEIWKAVQDVEKPVVIYMHGLCASGCLYIASGGDEIYAGRNTLVGSIGVISTFFNVEDLLDDVGVDVNIITTGESKDFGSVFREMTEEEEAYWREQIAVTLDHFIEVVANRNGSTLSEGDVRELATGQVWVAPKAEELGLVDELGYEDDAIERAAQLAGISDYRIQEYPFDFGFLDIFRTQAMAGEIELPDGYFTLPDLEEFFSEYSQPSLHYLYTGGVSTEAIQP